MSEQIQNSAVLQHHGILGQKWGIRRTESQLARGSKGTVSSKKVSAKETEKSKIKSMSDTELRQKINRIQMERQYSQLSKKDVSAGQKFVSDVFMNAAKQTATNYVSKYMTKGVDVLDVLLEKVLKK